MNEGMFIALRGLGQETNSLLMQILEEQRRTNEILSQLLTPAPVVNDATPIAKPAAKKGK